MPRGKRRIEELVAVKKYYCSKDMFGMLEWRREKKHSLMQMGIGIKIHFQRNKTHACQNFDSALDHDRHF